MYDLCVIGGGPAGFFAAISFKEKHPNSRVIILEKSDALLAKVAVSGGGRCNLTNACFEPKSLISNYPRGAKELLSPFNKFQPSNIMEWFNNKDVELKEEYSGRVFPKSNSSKTIIDCFTMEAKNLNIEIWTKQEIELIKKEEELFVIKLKNIEITSQNLLLATGSNARGYDFAKSFGHTIQQPLPSLFTFNIEKFSLRRFSGVAVKGVVVKLNKSNFFQKGSILITHQGFSGPVVLNLSAWAAKHLYKRNYKDELSVNWLGDMSQEELLQGFLSLKKEVPHKRIYTENIFKLPSSIWHFFLKAVDDIFDKTLNHISKKQLRVLSQKLTNDTYLIDGKSNNKSEFVTCGGITLKEVNFKTMESKICKNLYFAGEILDVDGITGGFNFQNAWSTAYVAATSI